MNVRVVAVPKCNKCVHRASISLTENFWKWYLNTEHWTFQNILSLFIFKLTIVFNQCFIHQIMGSKAFTWIFWSCHREVRGNYDWTRSIKRAKLSHSYSASSANETTIYHWNMLCGDTCAVLSRNHISCRSWKWNRCSIMLFRGLWSTITRTIQPKSIYHVVVPNLLLIWFKVLIEHIKYNLLDHFIAN